MSLIQDALNKVQKERSKITKVDVLPENKNKQEPDRNEFPIKKKLLIYLAVFITLTVVISVLFIKKSEKINRNRIIKIDRKPKIKLKKIVLPNKIIAEAKKTQIKKNENHKVISDLGLNKQKPIKVFENKITEKKSGKSKLVAEQKKIIQKIKKTNDNNIPEKSKKQKKKKNIKRMVLSKYELILKEADEFYKEKKYIDSALKYREALKLKKSKYLYTQIYRCYKSIGNFVLLRAFVVEALKHYQKDLFFNKVFGVLLYREKKYNSAVVRFNILLDKNSKDLESLKYKGLCLYNLKKYKRAASIFKSLLRLDESNLAYYYLGLVYDNLKVYNTALGYYETFKRLSKGQKRGINARRVEWVKKRILLLKGV